MELTANISGDEQAFLDLEYSASRPYAEFVYTSTEQALQVRRYLLDRKVGEFAPPHGRLLREQGRPVGMLAVLSGEDLTKCRLKAALALKQSGLLSADPAMAARLQLAGQTLLRVQPEDWYISRVATVEAERGRGLGKYLLDQAEQEARSRGFPRIVLEVAPSSTAALQMYRRQGYQQVDARQVYDPASTRSLEYHHLTKVLE